MIYLNNYKIFENLKNTSYNLKNCNLKVSKLLFGTQTLAEKMIDYKEGGKLLKYAYEQGINFWDTSDDYGTHLHVKEGINLVGRKKLKILSKITFYQNNIFQENIFENIEIHINKILYELGTNYLDILLLHAVDNNKMLEEYLSIIPQLEKLPIKNIGISSHVPDILSKIADNDKIKIVMAPINFKGLRIENNQTHAQRRDSMINILQKCKENKKDIIAIKVYGKEKIDNHEKAINFVNDLEFVDIIDIGMCKKEEIDQNIKIINKLK